MKRPFLSNEHIVAKPTFREDMSHNILWILLIPRVTFLFINLKTTLEHGMEHILLIYANRKGKQKHLPICDVV